jgi:hypothetical protein
MDAIHYHLGLLLREGLPDKEVVIMNLQADDI